MLMQQIQKGNSIGRLRTSAFKWKSREEEEEAVGPGAAVFDGQSSQHALSEHDALLSSGKMLWR